MRRGVWVLLLALVSLALLAALGSGLPTGGGGDELILSEVVGEVTVERLGESLAPEAGRVLTGSEHIETAEGGRAVLSLGADTRIRVGPAASLEVVQVGPEGVDIELEGGAVQATVRPTSPPVRLGSMGRQVQATDAEFAVAVQGRSMLIESRRGDLMAQGLPGVAAIEEGVRLVVDGEGGSEVMPIPEDLLLDVEWPSHKRTRASVTEIRGTTTPGATVEVAGAQGTVQTTADHQGSFVASLELDEGDNNVSVRATDLFGEEVAVDVVLVRDTRGPVFRGGVQ
ncbi:MAG: FecR domain-containing protein [Deltaproteobacteria bacterium]|nr:FecR domain-containing protein [Deltaproteobacteria bacterium]